MRVMEYDVQREEGQYHVREVGQQTRGTTLTDGWLKDRGYWPLGRANIDAAMNETMAMAGGQVLDSYAARHPLRQKDLSDFVPGFKSYPTRGPARRPRIPASMLFRT